MERIPLATATNIFFSFSLSIVKLDRREKEKNFQMASSTRPTRSSVARENSRQSSLGTHAPLNTPTRRFYPSQERLEVRTPGIPNPNIYVVQPFKNASVPKDFVYSKKVIELCSIRFEFD